MQNGPQYVMAPLSVTSQLAIVISFPIDFSTSYVYLIMLMKIILTNFQYFPYAFKSRYIRT